MIFDTREEAGALLAGMLEKYRGVPQMVVVALPRGGLPIGEALTRALDLPLGIFFVKKIPSPYNEEAGIGAVTENGYMQMNQEAVETLHVADKYIQNRMKEKLDQMQQKRLLYGCLPSDFSKKTVILTDDGIATGSSMILGAQALKKAGVAKVIIAVPVAPLELLPLLEQAADEIYVYHPSDNLIAVGRFYRDFHQLDDNEVMEILNRTRH